MKFRMSLPRETVLGVAIGVLLTVSPASSRADEPDPFFVDVHMVRPTEGSTVDYGPFALDFSVVPNVQDTTDTCQILDGQYPFDEFPHIGTTVWSEPNCDPDSPPTVPALPAGKYTLIIQTNVPEHVNPGIVVKFSIAPPAKVAPPPEASPGDGGKGPGGHATHQKKKKKKKKKKPSHVSVHGEEEYNPYIAAEFKGWVPFVQTASATLTSVKGKDEAMLSGVVRIKSARIRDTEASRNIRAVVRTDQRRDIPINVQKDDPLEKARDDVWQYRIGSLVDHIDLRHGEKVLELRLTTRLEADDTLGIPFSHMNCSFVTKKCRR
jgi:hypothetical protein